MSKDVLQRQRVDECSRLGQRHLPVGQSGQHLGVSHAKQDTALLEHDLFHPLGAGLGIDEGQQRRCVEYAFTHYWPLCGAP